MKQCACLFIHRTASLVHRTAALVFVVITACQPVSASLPTALPPTQTPVESLTPSPIPTITLTASPTPTIEELISPYTIDGLRQYDFQSGSVHIRSILNE